MKDSELFEFYNIDILSVYQNRPDKYEVYTDNFEGRISIRDDYYETLSQEERFNINVQFGYRTKKDGELVLAVYLPDLRKASSVEKEKWIGHKFDDFRLFEDNDERFNLFIRRNIFGKWDIENGILCRIRNIISEINALTEMTLNETMFEYEEDVHLTFPVAENDHKYQDAHLRAYGFLIDGLKMEAIKKISNIQNIQLDKNIEKTLKALIKVLPKHLQNKIIEPFNNVSDNRRPATHKTRKSAVKYPAFSEFNSDMDDIFKSLELIKEFIEKITNVSTEVCMERKNKLEMLPKFDYEKKILPNYSICKFNNIVGKTIKKVEIGFKKCDVDNPESELSLLHFTDGSMLSISIVSNINQLISSDIHSIAKDLSLQFHLNFVPSLKKN
ncbi:MAG: hypothetical protein KAW88_06925 [Candidatus Cloacimonetes bacterium]|nr:hypothetical protein [Candidatus Cloacimonadota bacterium]